MNKVIYRPSGKAREYSQWACNFYNGCANDCTYCYCKKGFLSRLWSTSPTLKKGLRDNAHAMEVFRKELDKNIEQLRNSYLFFSFTTDPLLPSTRELTIEATLYALSQGVRVSILTKCEEMEPLINSIPEEQRVNVAIGFTLTGCDEQEPNAATNKERMQAMRQMYILGFRTYASIEPIIDPAASMAAMTKVSDFCELFKVGVLSGTKNYTSSDIREMVGKMAMMTDCKFYLKDSLVSFATLEREKMGKGIFVPADFNLFTLPTPKEAIIQRPELVLLYSVLITNDIACSMALEPIACIKSDKDLYRHIVKKRVDEFDRYRSQYEGFVKKKFVNDTYFYADICQNMMERIEDDVERIRAIIRERLQGNIGQAELFVKLEIARLFAGIACVSYDKRRKELDRIGWKAFSEFRLTKILGTINQLYTAMLDRYKFEGCINLNNDETSKIVGRISLKLIDPKIMQDVVYKSEIENIREVE